MYPTDEMKKAERSKKNPPTTPSQWEEGLKIVWEGWITNYLISPDAFDMDLRESVAFDEVRSFFSQTLQQERQRWVAELEGLKNDNPSQLFTGVCQPNRIFNEGLQTAIDTLSIIPKGTE